MNIKAMYHFNQINEFINFSNFIEEISWQIEKQLLKNRVEDYKDLDVFTTFKHKFLEENISIWQLKDEEVITWIDTVSIMRRLLFSIFKKGFNLNNMNIIMEYPLKYGNHMRSDYLIVYERLIIVVEFGMFNQDEKRSEERYTKKLQDSINYRQLISNLVSKEIKVVNYSMIYRPEYDKISSRFLEDNIKYNEQEISLLVAFIIKNVIEQDNLRAIIQLSQI